MNSFQNVFDAGIRDPIVKAKFSTPFGIDGDAVVTMSHFEADVVAVLPRKSNRIEVKKVVILKMEDVHLDVSAKSLNEPMISKNGFHYLIWRFPLMSSLNPQVKTQPNSDAPPMDFSKIANQFLKTTPKGVLYPLIGTFVKRFAQQYLDENPLPF